MNLQLDFMVPKKPQAKWQDLTHQLQQDDQPEKLKKRVQDAFHSIGKIPCFPLKTIIAAVGARHVDFLSLDVQGVDLKVLKTLSYEDDGNTPKIDVRLKILRFLLLILDKHFKFQDEFDELKLQLMMLFSDN